MEWKTILKGHSESHFSATKNLRRMVIEILHSPLRGSFRMTPLDNINCNMMFAL